MPKVFQIFLILCSLAVCTLASAQNLDVNFAHSGNDFLRICDSTQPVAYIDGACMGYVQGVVEGADILVKQPLFCPGPDVTLGQRYRIIVKFLKEHPEKTDQQTRYLVVEAMKVAFPCSDK
jgi:hypothetical protein